MPFWVVSCGVGQGMGAYDGVEIVEQKGAVLGVMWASRCKQWGLCGVVILCCDGRRRGSSQITWEVSRC